MSLCIYLCLYMSVCVSVCGLGLYVCVCMSLYVSMYIALSISVCVCICLSVCVVCRVGHNTAEALAHIHLLTEFSSGFETCPLIGRSLTNRQSPKTGQR